MSCHNKHLLSDYNTILLCSNRKAIVRLLCVSQIRVFLTEQVQLTMLDPIQLLRLQIRVFLTEQVHLTMLYPIQLL